MKFDLLANDWDTEERIKRAEIIAQEIKENIKIRKDDIAMDFGCGTGLISFNLHDDFKRIDLIDNSEGMIKRLDNKIKESKLLNMNPKHLNLTKNLVLDSKYDVIYSSMVIHHISDVHSIIETLYNHLSDEGKLCIIDLNKVSESFHKEEQTFAGHHGFEITELNQILEHNNLKDIKAKTFYHSEKKFDHETIPYSLFIMTAVKRRAVK